MKSIVYLILVALMVSGCSKKRSQSTREKVAQEAAQKRTQQAAREAELKAQAEKTRLAELEKEEKRKEEAAAKEKARAEARQPRENRESEGARNLKPGSSSVNTPAVRSQLPETNANSTNTKPSEKADVAAPAALPQPQTEAPPAQTNLLKGQATPSQAARPEAAKSESQASAEVQYIELSFLETRNLSQVLITQFGEKNLPRVLSPIARQGLDGSLLRASVSGTYKKAHYKMLHRDETLVEFLDLAFDLTKTTQAKSGDYQLQALCVGTNCELLFVHVFRFSQDKKVSENYPSLFTLKDGQYRPATPMRPEAYRAELAKQKDLTAEEQEAVENKAPPQIRVMALHEKNWKKHDSSIVKTIQKLIEPSSHMYSARLFANFKPGSFDHNFKRISESEIGYEMKIDFAKTEKRPSLLYKGVVKSGQTQMAAAADPTKTLNLRHLGDHFYLLTYASPNFQTPLKASLKLPQGSDIKAFQCEVCQLLEEKGEIYSHCEWVTSTQILNYTGGYEGRVGGPIYLGQKVEKVGENDFKVEEVILEKVPEKKTEEKPLGSEPQIGGV
ncbi:MAG: hypothetical protein ACK5Y2_03485 [Bdellovibrionales bacterium]